MASQFDPFSAVANWKQAQDVVEEQQLNARSIERAYAELLEAPTLAGGQDVDLELMEVQLRQLKQRIRDAAANGAVKENVRSPRDGGVQPRPREIP